MPSASSRKSTVRWIQFHRHPPCPVPPGRRPTIPSMAAAAIRPASRQKVRSGAGRAPTGCSGHRGAMPWKAEARYVGSIATGFAAIAEVSITFGFSPSR